MELLKFVGMFAGGLVLLLVGGRVLVDAAASMAARLGVPALLVGLTIVAWGTSAPELAFNTISAVKDRTDLVFGNLVGANICNIALILGIGALIRPLAVGEEVIRRELPVLAATMLLALVLGVVGQAGFARLEGALLLGVFLVYSAFTIISGIRAKARASPLEGQIGQSVATTTTRSMVSCAAGFVAGLVLLGIGGSLAADGASGAAEALGVSPTVVGLTVVSVGTTLPELITAIIAIRKGHVDLAVGNAIGSCMFNIACILGLASVISPADLPENGLVALAVMTGLGFVLLPMARTHNRTISRIEGASLLTVYAAFVAFQVYSALSAPRGIEPADHPGNGGPGAPLGPGGVDSR